MATISALTLLLGGCGGAHFNATPTPTVSITASPTTITAGSSSTLTVTATNATSLTVSGSDGSSYTMSSTGGTQTVSPKTTTTYTATAGGLSGQTTATMTVTVSGSTAPPAPTVTITASPTSITAGGSSTLTVTATNATGVTVSGSDGSTYTLQANGGTQAVSPTATATYTATATGTGGKTTAAATVTVTSSGTPAPTVTITASPTSISAGSSSTLTVVAANATGVTVTGTDGSSYTLQASGGTQAVSPAATTTYTATATGAGGKTTATTVVTVTPAGAAAPTVTITASPTTIVAGNSSTLTVAATNATTVTVTGTDGSSYTLQANGGVQAITPAATTTYTATATGTGGKATASALVTVTPVAPSAPTVTITATPTTILAGNSSTLMVAATNATTVTVTGTDGSSYTLQANGGTQAVTPAVSTTYTATATGAGGKATATATVTVTPAAPPVPTVTIVANPTSITSGSSSTLTVTATNATTVTISGTDGSSYTLTATGGAQVISPTVTTTYTATATGAGGMNTAAATVTVTPPTTTVTITATPTTIFSGTSSTLTVVATNATGVTVAGTDGSSYTLTTTGGTQVVSPTDTTTAAITVTYTATATGTGASATATATVTVNPAATVQSSVNHVIFMMQENHTFDNYFGMLNPYRITNNYNVGDDGVTYTVDGIDDKLNKFSAEDDAGDSFKLFPLTSTCVDDESSDWLSSYGDVNRYDFLTTRKISENGFVHTAEGYATSCAQPGASCSGVFTDLNGQRSMGYYDEHFLNYYYYMASQFALSNRWFSPMSDKSIDNRIATFTGGTTQGLVLDPGGQDHLPQLAIPTIYNKLDKAGVSWKIYYTVSLGFCDIGTDVDDACTATGTSAYYPATDFSSLTYSFNYLYLNPTKAACTGTTVGSSILGDPKNSFCIDTNHIAPLYPTYFNDLANGTLPSFAFIEAGYANNDEHPGSGQSVLTGQVEMSKVLNAFMTSTSWNDSVFFFSYDEGGGPFEHVPPVPGHSNDNTDASLLASTTIPDISTIAVNADTYFPCVPPNPPGTVTTHCDVPSGWPAANPGDAPAVNGFAAQLGFRLPNIIISPFTRRHYVSNIPMDHTAILKFVEDRFIGDSKYLTPRDAAQPNLLDFFDFNNIPWATPPTTPVPVTPGLLGYNPCTPATFGGP